MRIVSMFAALLAVAGCASQDGLVAGGTAPVVVANARTDLGPQTTLHCHKESPPGSNMIHNVCEAEPSEAEREKLSTKLLDIGAQNAATHHAAGG